MSYSIPVHLIRQWCYCPRIVYYIELSDNPVTYPSWVRQGEEFHEKQARLWQRRNLSRFKLIEGTIHLNYHAKSEKYGIHGIADMVVETDRSVHPVEFKLAASSQKKGAILQLVAYAAMLEEAFCKQCTLGFLAEGDKLLHKIDITRFLMNDMENKVVEIKKMLEEGIKPDSSASIVQCSNCEYLNYCNDRC